VNRPLSIALAGDVMLGRHVDEVHAGQDPAYAWGDVLPVIEAQDLFLINLECALTTRTAEWRDGERKVFYFRADPDRATATLRRGRVDFASLANNHAGDFDVTGLIDTFAALDRAGIAHAGAGVNLAAARLPARLEVEGLRVAVVAFADYPEQWAATPSAPGINFLEVSTAPATMAVVRETLAAARAEADLVIFSIHWGPNMRPRPIPAFREFAHRVIDAGADVFWGHSAHIVQGIEVRHGNPILYDTGDFVDDYAIDPDLRNDLSALFVLRIAPPAITRLELLPVQIGDCQVNRARGRERDWIARRIVALSAEFGTRAVDDGAAVIVPVAAAGAGGR
jgi:poly-gamma-glutamate capsule biosynthesis protein CapA/YwtB (metallophosphatase superfamily)